MTEAELIAGRMDELDRTSPYFSEECDVVEEAIDDADAAGDITLWEKERLLQKFRELLSLRT